MAGPMGLTGAPAGQSLLGTGVGASGASLPNPGGAIAGTTPAPHGGVPGLHSAQTQAVGTGLLSGNGVSPGDIYHAPPGLGGTTTPTQPRFPSAHTMAVPASGTPPVGNAPNTPTNPGIPGIHSAQVQANPATPATINTGDVGPATPVSPTSFFPSATVQTTPTPPGTIMPPGNDSPAPAVPPTGGPFAGSPPAFTSPGGTQVSPAIGTPYGYDIGQGVDTSASSFMPSDITAGSFQDIPLTESTGPAAQTYINSVEGQAQGPTNWNVTPNQTVAGQYSQLMSGGNEAIQAAEEQTMRANAASGGRNSLMAQNAATLAGSQVALSIAQQDAQTYAQSAQYNATAANNFATNMNNFVESMTANQQSFDLGYAQLQNQFNVNMGTMYAQVVQGAAAASENVKQTLDNTQISTNATLEQMDKTFSQNVSETEMQNQFANEEAWTNYGMQVRASYLSSINQQQTALMQTIAAINSNPNINSTQAAAGIASAVSQFNSFMTMNNAYYSSMVPDSDTATYQAYNPDGWPNN